jgi:5-methyltetrahydrofolate--homocysteine methyltransferase
MIIIGERINSTRKTVAPAVEAKDVAFIQKEAKDQAAAGAHYIDVNVATMMDQECERMEWAIKAVQEATQLPICIDTPSPEAMKVGLMTAKGKAIMSSITGEKKRLETYIPLLKEHDCAVLALCMDDTGMPETAEQRFAVGAKLIGEITKTGKKEEDVFVDPLVRPVSTGSHYGTVVLETISRLKAEFPGVHVVCGLTNVSFGLPLRKNLNQAFLVLCMGAGLDAVILDPTDAKLMSLLLAADALLGNDEFGLKYIAASREERLVV